MQSLQTAQVHPDADLLTAFSEQTLTAREREQMLTHLAVCSTCREVVSLASPPVLATVAPQAATNPTFWKWPILRWGAVAASAVIVVVAVSIGQYENGATKKAQVTSDAAPIAVPAASEPKALQNEISLQPPASAGVRAPQIRYEKIAPKARKDDAIEHLNASFQTDSSKTSNLKKELNQPSVHGTVGGMVALKPSAAAVPMATDSFSAGEQRESTGNDLTATLADNELSRAAPPPPPPAEQAAEMAARGATVPSVSETVEVTAATPLINSQASTVSEAPAKGKQAGIVTGRNTAQLSRLSRDERYNSLDLKWQVTPEGYLQNSADHGRSWVNQLSGQRFTHVQTVGGHVWACGPDGVLMHSSDGGTNWTRVTPTEKDAKLQGEINNIVFSDVNHGTLKTSAGETWTTSDAGQSWKRNLVE